MQSQRYQKLNPLAFAIAAGVTWLVGSLLVGFSMMGMMGGMMGGPAMMGVYNHGSAMALSEMWWIGAVLAALIGAFFAWIYNGVNARYGTGSNTVAKRG